MTTLRPENRRSPRAEPPPADRTSSQETRGYAAIVTVRRIFGSESGNFYLLLGATLFLVVFGLVMVLSSSSIQSRLQSDDFFHRFSRQGLWAIIGIPIMLVASRFPPLFWRRISTPLLIGAMAMQLLVFTGLGWEYGGNRNWISIGPLNAQPSELVKVALVIWIAAMLAAKGDRIRDWKQAAIPVLPVGFGAIGLVLGGDDLGTAIIMLSIVLGSLFFAGARLSLLTLVIGILAAAAWSIASLSVSRRMRIDVWLSGCSGDSEYYSSFCWQTVHGWWAMASGGIFGVGLGNSSAKWSWLPEADNDFIFAIIGEELGMVGAVIVLLVYVVIAVALARIARAAPDAFGRIAVSAIMIWVIGQALVNIAVVLGLLPVLGVPLPLMSAGGSALVTTLLAIGIALSIARTGSRR